MVECNHQSILCVANGCKFIFNVKTVIIYVINCLFYLLYYEIYKSLSNVSVLTYDCNVIN